MIKGIDTSEEGIISLLAQTDAKGMEILYDQYACALFGVIYRIIPDEEAAEEVLKETFIKIKINFSQYDSSRSRLFTWIMNIARTLSLEKMRTNGFTGTKPSSFRADRTDHTDQINEVAMDQNKIIDLILFEGQSHTEASNFLNIPTAAFRSKVRTEMIQLKQHQLTLKEN